MSGVFMMRSKDVPSGLFGIVEESKSKVQSPNSKVMASFKENRQFFFYCLIGASGATLDFLIYFGLVFASTLHHQVANAIGYSSGTVVSFLLNSRFNFKIRDWLLLRFFSFCGVGLMGLSASAGT